MENWILVRELYNGREVEVRQHRPGSRVFIDKDGNPYLVKDLDFTVNFAERRKMARNKGINSRIDKLWVANDAIFLRGADTEKAESFVLSLGAFGYDTQKLMTEYKQTGKITI